MIFIFLNNWINKSIYQLMPVVFVWKRGQFYSKGELEDSLPDPGPLVSSICTGFVDFRLSLASEFTSYGSRQTPFSTTKIADNRLSLRGQVPVLVDGILLPPSWSRNMKWNMKRHCTGWPDVHIVLRTQHVFCS